MKRLGLVLGMALALAACEGNAEFGQKNGTGLFAEPYGVEVVDASMSYNEYGVFENDTSGVLSMGTRGDMVLKFVLTNTTNIQQVVGRQHLLIDLDGKLVTTPSRLYDRNIRAKQAIYIKPHQYVEVVVYIENAFGRMDAQWRNRRVDLNASYSIDVRLANSYLFGRDIYAHHNENEGWIMRYKCTDDGVRVNQ